jgi:hypothetical protein
VEAFFDQFTFLINNLLHESKKTIRIPLGKNVSGILDKKSAAGMHLLHAHRPQISGFIFSFGLDSAFFKTYLNT